MDLSIQRVHARRDANSTKLAHNTYGRITWRSVDSTVLEARIQHHNTEIITFWYTVEGSTLTIKTVRIALDGWHTSTTVRRVNQFFKDNGIKCVMFTYEGMLMLLSLGGINSALADRRHGLYKNLRDAYNAYNMYSPHDEEAYIQCDVPLSIAGDD